MFRYLWNICLWFIIFMWWNSLFFIFRFLCFRFDIIFFFRRSWLFFFSWFWCFRFYIIFFFWWNCLYLLCGFLCFGFYLVCRFILFFAHFKYYFIILLKTEKIYIFIFFKKIMNLPDIRMILKKDIDTAAILLKDL